MTQITETTPPKQALNIQAVLNRLGFNTTLLNSKKHVTTQLRRLTPTELAEIKHAFAENPHPRLQKTKTETANLQKLTKLIGITATLLQTKTYLFWQDKQSRDQPSQNS
jgi:hypothetical protein